MPADWPLGFLNQWLQRMLMLGFTRDESLGGIGPVHGLEEFRTRAAAAFGDRAETFLSLYPASNDSEVIAQARAADHDSTMTSALDAWARAQVRSGSAPVYSYMFARPHSYMEGVIITDIDPVTA